MGGVWSNFFIRVNVSHPYLLLRAHLHKRTTSDGQGGPLIVFLKECKFLKNCLMGKLKFFGQLFTHSLLSFI